MNPEGASFIQTRSDSSGKLELMSSIALSKSLSFKTEGFFMDNDMKKAHVSFELMKEFADSYISYKTGGGSHNISMMQSLNPNLMAGFEMYYIPHTRDVQFCYAATY